MEQVLKLNEDRKVINEEIHKAALTGAKGCEISMSKLNIYGSCDMDKLLAILEKEIRMAGYGYAKCPGLPDSIIITWDGSELIEMEKKE